MAIFGRNLHNPEYRVMSERIREGRIVVEREARYFRFSESESESESDSGDGPVWVVFHGYGQCADVFLQQCRPLLEDSSGLIVAPEGLSRFYRRSGRGELGASWMTKLMREGEISEYLTMIDRVLDDCGVSEETTLMLLGFSQGGATAMRYALRSGRPVGRCVLWGAGFDETELETYRGELVRIAEVIFAVGESDRIVKRAVSERTRDSILRSGGAASLISHRGGHELDDGLLRILGRTASTDRQQSPRL